MLTKLGSKSGSKQVGKTKLGMEMAIKDHPSITYKEKMVAIRKIHPEIKYRFEEEMGSIFSDLFEIKNKVDNLR